MQRKDEKTLQIRNIVGRIIKDFRINQLKLSCNEFERAYEFSRGNVNRIENCVVDCKLISFWKVAEGLGMKPSELLALIEKELGDDFKLIDE